MEYIRTATREYATGSQLSLDVDSRSGNVVVEGQDVDQVTVQIVAHVWEESAEAADGVIDHLVAGIREGEGSLSVRMPELPGAGRWMFFGRGPRIDYAITVPRRTSCTISNRSGRVEVSRIAGPVQIDQRSGRTTVRAIASDVNVGSRSGSTEVEDVSGAVRVSAHSGKAIVRGAGGDVSVSCHSGAVQVERVEGSLQARSHSGRIAASDIAGDTQIDAKSGAILLTNGRAGARLRSISGQATFRGPVLGDLDIQTASGAIQLEIDPDRPFFVEAESVSGSIRSDLTVRREADAPPATAPRVRLHTGSGSIRIGRYNGF
jgi:DUF4097 and DUF4098 domain-containing protein YvlB